jgi:hypothetical protein
VVVEAQKIGLEKAGLHAWHACNVLAGKTGCFGQQFEHDVRT